MGSKDVFPDRLREVRKARALTQRQLAKASSVHFNTISGIEARTHTARPSTVRKLAEALGVPVEELTGGPRQGADSLKQKMDEAVAYYDELFDGFEREASRAEAGLLTEAQVEDLQQRISSNVAVASVSLKHRPLEASRFLRRGAALLLREAERVERAEALAPAV